MNSHVLTAIRSEPWAIVPAYLDAIEALALRMMDHPALIQVERDGHQARFADATARMGERAPGTRTAALRDGVGIVPMFGPVFPRAGGLATSGATTLDAVAADLRALEASPEVRNVLMTIDSPGGAVSGVHDFARYVANFSKPIAVHVSGQCCSAVYWIASQASGGISLDPTGVVGSIGVCMSTSYQRGRTVRAVVRSTSPVRTHRTSVPTFRLRKGVPRCARRWTRSSPCSSAPWPRGAVSPKLPSGPISVRAAP